MENCSINFWNHQKEMFRKCQEIEQNSPIGIMADRPGSGKTFVSLAIISDFVKKNQDNLLPTIIVISENIYKQWCNSIEKFNNLTYLKFIEYQDISRLYFDISQILKYNILLTTPIYYNIIAQNLNNIEMKISRLIIDEIDSISHILNENLDCDHTWLISGTFNQNHINSIKQIYDLSNLKIDEITCKFNDDFYTVLEDLEEPEYTDIICHNIYLDNILSKLKNEIFDGNELEKLNALDYEGFASIAGISMELKSIRQSTEAIINLKKRQMNELTLNMEITKQHIHKTNQEIDSLLSKNILSIEDMDLLDKLKISLKSLSTSKENIDKNLKNATIKYEKIMERIKTEKMCMTCYSEENENFIATDCCQSIHCYDCLSKWLKKSSDCPYCKTNLRNDDRKYNYIEYDSDEEIFSFDDFKLHFINNDDTKDVKINKIATSKQNIKKIKQNIIENIKVITNDFNDIEQIDDINLYEYITDIDPSLTDYIIDQIKDDIKLILSDKNQIIQNKLKQLNQLLNKNTKNINNSKESIKNNNKSIEFQKNKLKNKEKELFEKLNSEKDKAKKMIGEQYKFSKLEQVEKILNNVHNSEKIIIFSNHTKVFTDIIKILNKTNKKYIELDNADIIDITNKIYDFKNNDDLNILMANTYTHGAGLNLEFVDIIIIVHKMNDDLKKQLIARAQRPGRSDQLEVYQLLHLNEIEN